MIKFPLINFSTVTIQWRGVGKFADYERLGESRVLKSENDAPNLPTNDYRWTDESPQLHEGAKSDKNKKPLKEKTSG